MDNKRYIRNKNAAKSMGATNASSRLIALWTLNSDLNVINKDSSIDVPFKEYIQKCISSCILRVE